MSVVSDRIRARIALGDVAGAERDYQILRGIDAQDPKTAFAAFTVGKHLRPAAEAAFEKIVGKATPFKGLDWTKAVAKPGFAAAVEGVRRPYGYYREWLLAGSGQKKLSYWELVCFMWGRTGDWDAIYDIHRKALSRFDGMAGVDPKKLLIWKNKLFHATVALAKKADLEGKADEGSRLWNEAGQLGEVLVQGGAYRNNPFTIRLAAQVFGGYVAKRAGLVKYSPCLGRYAEALALWKKIERSLKAIGESGSDGWWEAKFYTYYAAYEQERAAGQDLKQLRRKLDTLLATNPDGNPAWNDYFGWLKNKLF